MMYQFITLALLLVCATLASAGTSIKVYNEYKKEVNVKIKGTGVGGCDILLNQGENNLNDCWCLWGTINYSFCVYTASKVKSDDNIVATNTTSLVDVEMDKYETGKCAVVTGESLLCSDVSSLGNCYDKSYTCKIDSSGLCHCSSD